MGDALNLEIISRLERLEARMRVAESIAPVHSGGLVGTEVERVLRLQSTKLETIQGRLVKAEEQIAKAAESRNELMVLHGGGVPAPTAHELDDHIEASMDDMRLQIEEDLAKLNRRTLSTIETLVDARIAGGVEPIEKVVRNHAKAFDELRERFNLLEGHLQRLVTTVERLVERSAGKEAGSPEQPTFRTYLDHAVRNDPIPPPPEVDPMFRLRIIKDDDTKVPTPRRPMSPVT